MSGVKWSENDLNRFREKNLKNKSKTKKSELSKGSKEKAFIHQLLITKKQDLCSDLEVEYRFSAHHVGLGKGIRDRLRSSNLKDWRFDWAFPNAKIAIEYEGLMSKKSGHTTIIGYTSDCEKYNAAQILGWKVFRYTALNYKDLICDIEKLTSINDDI